MVVHLGVSGEGCPANRVGKNESDGSNFMKKLSSQLTPANNFTIEWL